MLNRKYIVFLALATLLIVFVNAVNASTELQPEYTFSFLGIDSQNNESVTARYRVGRDDGSSSTGHIQYFFSTVDGIVDYTSVTGYSIQCNSLSESECIRVTNGAWEIEQSFVNGTVYNAQYLVPHTCGNCTESPLDVMTRFYNFSQRNGSQFLPIATSK